MINSAIALALGAGTYFIVSYFSPGDMPVLASIWVSMAAAAGLNMYAKLKKK